MKTPADLLSDCLAIIEQQYDNDTYFDPLELEQFCIASVYANKHYGRPAPRVFQVVNSLEGLGIGSMLEAGLTDTDVRNCYQKKCMWYGDL